MGLVADANVLPPFGTSPIVFTVVLLLTAIVSGRLLGVRLGLFRRLLAAFVGFIAGYALLYFQATKGPASGLVFGIPALLVTMIAITLMELLARPGSIARLTPGLRVPHPLHSTAGRLKRSRRYAQIVWIATRWGLGPSGIERGGEAAVQDGSARALGVRLRRALEQAGGAFIKFGQVLSTRQDLLPLGVTAELALLQDTVPPAAEASVLALLRQELGREPEEMFAEFARVPVAAASLAQAHRASLADGSQLIVKVQRPGAQESIETDLDILRRLVTRLSAREAWARDLHIAELADGFRVALLEELDFQIECANLEAMSRGAAASYGIRIPRPYSELSTDRILTMEWLDGVSIRAAGERLHQLKADRNQLARTLLHCELQQIFVDGIFHADPHPGNVLVLPDGGLALIDAGSVGRLNAAEQSALQRVLLGVDRRDPVAVRDALVEIAPIHDARAEELLERSLAQFIASRLGPGMSAGAAFFNDLVRLLAQFKLSLPPQVAAVFRAMVTLEGTLHVLVPAFDVIAESKRFASEKLGDHLQPRSLATAVENEVLMQLPVLSRLPRRLHRLMDTAEYEGLALRVSIFDSARDQSFVATLFDRVLLVLVGAATGAIGVALLAIPGSPGVAPGVSLLQVIGYSALIACAILLLRVVIAVARDRLV